MKLIYFKECLSKYFLNFFYRKKNFFYTNFYIFYRSGIKIFVK